MWVQAVILHKRLIVGISRVSWRSQWVLQRDFIVSISSSEFQLLVVGDLNKTSGKEMHENRPEKVGWLLQENESSGNDELMPKIITELNLCNQKFFLIQKMSWWHYWKKILTERLLSKFLSSGVNVQYLRFSWQYSQDSDQAMMIKGLREKICKKTPASRKVNETDVKTDTRGRKRTPEVALKWE